MSSQSVQLFRTLLFAPAIRPDLLAKAQSGDADALIFDLEDSVPVGAKVEARKNAARVLASGVLKPVFLRISNPRAGDAQSDVAVLSEAKDLSSVVGVIVPKADHADDVRRVAALLADVEEKAGVDEGSLRILPLVETCLGLRNTFEIATASPRVCGMALASAEEGDFMVDLGGRWTRNSLALAYPRSKLIVDSRAAGLQWLVDGVFMNLTDAEALRTECEIARELGFVGKMAIHPAQVGVMQQVFSPSAGEIDYARGLVAAFEEGEARGVGAIKYRGTMVDYANVRLAQRTLALVREDLV
jgi:citrate lyase subunit beta / citryl-CoA lyase